MMFNKKLHNKLTNEEFSEKLQSIHDDLTDLWLYMPHGNSRNLIHQTLGAFRSSIHYMFTAEWGKELAEIVVKNYLK